MIIIMLVLFFYYFSPTIDFVAYASIVSRMPDAVLLVQFESAQGPILAGPSTRPIAFASGPHSYSLETGSMMLLEMKDEEGLEGLEEGYMILSMVVVAATAVDVVPRVGLPVKAGVPVEVAVDLEAILHHFHRRHHHGYNRRLEERCC